MAIDGQPAEPFLARNGAVVLAPGTRLDDGWKPFWLDTLAIEPGQTQRIALSAEYAGRWLMETMATDWAAPRLLRFYIVD